MYYKIYVCVLYIMYMNYNIYIYIYIYIYLLIYVFIIHILYIYICMCVCVFFSPFGLQNPEGPEGKWFSSFRWPGVSSLGNAPRQDMAGRSWGCRWKVVIYRYIWVNYSDLTVLPHWESWLIREIIPKWPNYSGEWNMIIYPDRWVFLLRMCISQPFVGGGSNPCTAG